MAEECSMRHVYCLNNLYHLQSERYVTCNVFTVRYVTSRLSAAQECHMQFACRFKYLARDVLVLSARRIHHA